MIREHWLILIAVPAVIAAGMMLFLEAVGLAANPQAHLRHPPPPPQDDWMVDPYRIAADAHAFLESVSR